MGAIRPTIWVRNRTDARSQRRTAPCSTTFLGRGKEKLMCETTPIRRQARPFQQRVNVLVSAGNSVVLQAPTGSGKTRAALEPFVLNLARGEGQDTLLPRTCRYAVPMRVLASQFYREYNDLKMRIDRHGGS